MNTQKEVGQLIKSFRKSKGLTNLELCEIIGISFATLSRIENGHLGVSANILKKLSELGMNIEDITYANRLRGEEESLSFRLGEVENKLVKMEELIKKILVALDKKE